jgi:hypothetical protein
MLRVFRPLVLCFLIFATNRLVCGETINFADLVPTLPHDAHNFEDDGFSFPFFRYTTINGSNVVFATYYPFQDCCYNYPISDPRLQSVNAGFYEQDSAEFTLNSLEITSDTTVQIFGLRQGVVVDQISVATDGLNITPVFLTLDWSDIDFVAFPDIVAFHQLELDEFTVNEAPVPEPTSIVFLASGILALVAAARRKRFLHSVVHKMCS